MPETSLVGFRARIVHAAVGDQDLLVRVNDRTGALTEDVPEWPNQTAEDFAVFIRQSGRSLGRLAYLLMGDEHTAEDLTAEVYLATWRQWDRVSRIEFPLAYLRQMMANMAAARFRRQARERRGLERMYQGEDQCDHEPDSAAVVDVRSALQGLSPKKRACLVLRFGFDLTEREVAEILGVTVGTVKSQTYKAVRQFRQELGDRPGEANGFLEPAPSGRQRRAGG